MFQASRRRPSIGSSVAAGLHSARPLASPFDLPGDPPFGGRMKGEIEQQLKECSLK